MEISQGQTTAEIFQASSSTDAYSEPVHNENSWLISFMDAVLRFFPPGLRTELGDILSRSEMPDKQKADSLRAFLNNNQASLDEIHHLDLHRQQLTDLPQEIDLFRNLVILNLGDNSLSTLPDSISSLSELQELNLTHNNFSEFPGNISSLVNLRFLLLNRNQLREIPDRILDISTLETLNLSGNPIEFIPENIGDLRKLKQLILANTLIEKLPESLCQCEQLEKLDLLGSRRLDNLDEILSQLQESVDVRNPNS